MTQLHVLMGADAVHAQPVVRRIGLADLKDALGRGIDDFMAMPSHAVSLCLIYPILGLLIGSATFGYGMVPLLFPLVAGFALLGPFAAVGLYELSRQRERGLAPDLTEAFDVFYLPSFGAIAALGFLLLMIFVVWLTVAQAIYVAYFGYAPVTSVADFARSLFTTREGWSVMLLGNGIGFLFALVVLTISVVSFPLLLDRDVGAVEALATSFRAVRMNPIPTAVWGLIVAAALLLGSVPFLLGLAVVMPVLGHATWHLYRKMVEPDPLARHERLRPPPKQQHYAAQFPSALFAGEDRPKQP
ncbi:MAG: hypothetical protein QOI12_1109 [Alphaproteobacteria bacterium]|nr:hypothetical protein [Alphaproteobacteria bacterium]